MSGRMTRLTLRFLDRVAELLLHPPATAPHQKVGTQGEDEAYFFLRGLGYVMVARNFRSPRRRGDLDLVGWDGDVLCFIEVKTRTTRDVKPAEAAVDYEKQQELARVAREYLRHAPPLCQWRFDVLSVYYEHLSSSPRFELFRNAFQMS